MAGWQDGRMAGWQDGRMAGWQDADGFVVPPTGQKMLSQVTTPIFHLGLFHVELSEVLL